MHLQLLRLKELPIINDASIKGLRLQGTLAKALPPMKQAGSMTNVRQMEAEKFAREMAYVFAISKGQEKQGRMMTKAIDDQAGSYSKKYSKGTGSQGKNLSNRQAARKRASKYRAASAYGYNPDQAMRYVRLGLKY